MLRNYLRIAWRNVRRHKVSTAINVAGLAVGMAWCLWLFMFVQHEWAFDRFHEDADRIVRINQETVHGDGSVEHAALTPPPLGPAMETSVPEVEAAVRLHKSTIEIQRASSAEERDVLFADPGFFEVFTFPLLAGDPDAALAAPNQIVLSASEARRLFGAENPVGQILTIAFEHETRDVTVSGVAEDPPVTSSIPFSLVMPMENFDLTLPEGHAHFILGSWGLSTMFTFARLRPGSDRTSLAAKLDRLVREHVPDAETTTYDPQPITEIHHATEVSSGLVPTSDPRYAYILGAMALFVLAIAAINFVTLTLGRSTERAGEVGVRKSVGATRAQLGTLFWCEAMLVCGLAVLVGVVIARAFLPVFTDLINVPLRLAILEQPVLWIGFAVLVLGVGLLAGGYPAWVLARLEAAPVLRGRHGMRARGGLSRALIVVQFALSVGLVACAFIMSHQLRYMTEADLGYTDAPIVTLRPETSNDDRQHRYEAFKQEAERHPAVHAVTRSAVTFGPKGLAPLELEGRTGDVVRGHFNLIEPNFVKTMGLEIVAGRALRASGSAPGLLVNERLVTALGLDDPIGTTLSVHGSNVVGESLDGVPIRGVIRDYHVSALDEEIPPLILAPSGLISIGVRTYSARLHTGQTEAGLAALAATWKRVFPAQPFEYTLLQDRIAGQYASERRWRALVGYAAVLALLIACFGVFGQAALETARRTTEVGIRKVLGASATSLVALLSKDLARLVTFGAVLAAPLAYVAVQRWLEGFAYRVEPAWWIFAAAGGVALTVALATASYHALKAARMDPTVAIRHE